MISSLRLHKGIIYWIACSYGLAFIASHCFLEKLLDIFSFVRWVDQCSYNLQSSYAHDKNRRVEKFQVGQNWAMLAGSYLENMSVGESGSNMIQDWYDEVSDVGRI